jgi:catechol 2,3-dioxygenase-like lactoylglutathione lyase family enzyme
MFKMGIALKKNSIDLGIVTTNGPAMLSFYRDTLGLQYEKEIPMPVGAGVMHRMYCGETLIKLVVQPSSPAKAPPGGIGGATGYRYWTMTVSNLDEITEACQKAGAKIAIAPKEIRPGVRISMVEDPDGNWVEFLSIA